MEGESGPLENPESTLWDSDLTLLEFSSGGDMEWLDANDEDKFLEESGEDPDPVGWE